VILFADALHDFTLPSLKPSERPIYSSFLAMKFSYFTDLRKHRTEIKMGHFSLSDRLHVHHHGKENRGKPTSTSSTPNNGTPNNGTPQQSPKSSSLQTENGFLKVQPGDAFQDGRFVVQKPLGSGRYSNVWLVQDNK